MTFRRITQNFTEAFENSEGAAYWQWAGAAFAAILDVDRFP